MKGKHFFYEITDPNGRPVAELCTKKAMTKECGEAIAAALKKNDEDVL